MSLRVSVATLVSVILKTPGGRTMLALERTATLRKINGQSEVFVKAKPFGGGVRLTDPPALKKIIGDFHYDSKRSLQEQDFRLQINPLYWDKIKEICKEHLNGTRNRILDPGPERELKEEFKDSLGIKITPDDYYLQKNGMVIEDIPGYTDNINATGFPTVRAYYLFEAEIKNPEIIRMMINNSKEYSDTDLKELAWEDVRQGGKGRANAVLSVYRDELKDFYLSVPIGNRDRLLRFGKYQLDGNVPAILEEIDRPKYQHYPG